jgi:hypothetical protein
MNGASTSQVDTVDDIKLGISDTVFYIRSFAMAFPIEAYDKAVSALRAVVADRDTKGRNETNDFYSQFPHGSQDLTFELHRRVQRILGAEKLGNSQVVYEDTLDLANYAIFLMMTLAQEKNQHQDPPADHQTQTTAIGLESGETPWRPRINASSFSRDSFVPVTPGSDPAQILDLD